jgi:hypothetical protein
MCPVMNNPTLKESPFGCEIGDYVLEANTPAQKFEHNGYIWILKRQSLQQFADRGASDPAAERLVFIRDTFENKEVLRRYK